MPRKTLSKALRFEVFKRDAFKCQYCGAEAPTVVLHADHIEPVSKGGKNELINLITACESCNSGKSDKRLSDDSAVQKQRRQLDDLSARREQLEMMLSWRNGLSSLAADEKEAIRDAFSAHVPGWSIKDESKLPATWLRQYGLGKTLDAIELSAERYTKYDADGKVTDESCQEIIRKVSGILRMGEMDPDTKRLHYIRGIIRNRMYMPVDMLDRLKEAVRRGVSVDDIEHEAKTARNWTEFNGWLTIAKRNADEEPF